MREAALCTEAGKKGNCGCDGVCSLPHQLDANKPAVPLYSLLRLCRAGMQN